MPSPSDNTAAAHDLSAKKARACDACRRRKSKCDGSSMSNNVCTNCVQARRPCTYVEASKPRGPPKAYITGLEDRLETLEGLLQQIRPGEDFSEQLGPPVARGSWKAQDASNASLISARQKSPISNNILPPLLIPYHSRNDGQSRHSAKICPPRSTHLILRSKLSSRRTHRDSDALSSTSEESSDETTSSSEEVEETVISSLAGREKITLFVSENDNSTEDDNIRFHGRSSTAGLIEITRQFKHMHMKDTTNPPPQNEREKERAPSPFPSNLTMAQWRRPAYWRRPKWEYSYENHRADSLQRLRVLLDYFPPPDLANALIDLYFQHSNSVYPLLHRPTFNRQWKEELHRRNIWFAGVCLSMFAIASRWSEDIRVLPTIPSEESTVVEWKYAGRQYFDMVAEIHRIRESLLHPTSLFEVQTFTLMGMYLQSAADFPAAWMLISTGLRKTQDVGAHRKKIYRDEPNLDDELWKRAFWMLVILDRLGGVSLGRACSISEEDFDLDSPLEADDGCFDPDTKQFFRQPAGVPSTLTAFVQIIKLTQIMAFSMRTLYAINKSKVYYGVAPVDRKLVTKQLSLAMSEWLEQLPEHLRWKENMENSLFLVQSTGIFALYHLIEMLIWRPLIGAPAAVSTSLQNENDSAQTIKTIASVPASGDPAIAKCTEAARACARIVEFQLQHGVDTFYVPGAIEVSYICAGFFLFDAWNLKVQDKRLRQQGMPESEPLLSNRIEQDISEAKIFLHVLEKVKDRWDIVDVLLGELNESLTGLVELQVARSTDRTPGVKKSQSISSLRKSRIDTQIQHHHQLHEHATTYHTSEDFSRSTSQYEHPITTREPYPRTGISLHTIPRTIPIEPSETSYATANESWNKGSVRYTGPIGTVLSTDSPRDHTFTSNNKGAIGNTQLLPVRDGLVIPPDGTKPANYRVYLTPQHLQEGYSRDQIPIPRVSYSDLRSNHQGDGWTNTRLQRPGEVGWRDPSSSSQERYDYDSRKS